jgi:hypothetical protein
MNESVDRHTIGFIDGADSKVRYLIRAVQATRSLSRLVLSESLFEMSRGVDYGLRQVLHAG